MFLTMCCFFLLGVVFFLLLGVAFFVDVFFFFRYLVFFGQGFVFTDCFANVFLHVFVFFQFVFASGLESFVCNIFFLAMGSFEFFACFS